MDANAILHGMGLQRLRLEGFYSARRADLHSALG
jgi:hypothetical protein